jgi:hypothetical protein
MAVVIIWGWRTLTCFFFLLVGQDNKENYFASGMQGVQDKEAIVH